jgi:polyisoprenoid-binding protein YceI
MRMSLAGCLFAALLLSSAAAHAEPEAFTIDPGHTFPTFEVKHLGVATQRGRFNRTTGKVTLDLKAGTGAVEINIEAASADTGNPELDRLLRGQYYFNIAEYPLITYKSTGISFEGEKPVLFKGELSFLGQIRPVELKVLHFACTRVPLLGRRCGADLTASFRRSDFGMTAMQGFVGDEVTLLIQAEAVRAAEPAK